jgi:hypothetical protein
MAAETSASLRRARQRLWIARAVSLTLIVLTLALFIASIPVYYAHLRTVCLEVEACPSERLSVEQAEALEAHGLSVLTWAAYQVTVDVVFFLIWFAVGALIFWLRSDDLMALLVALFLVTFGGSFGSGPDVLAAASPVWRVPFTLVETLGSALLLLFLYLFPNGRFVPGWTRWSALVWAAGWGLAMLVWVAGWLFGTYLLDSPFDLGRWPAWLSFAWFAGGLGSGLFAQVYRYRRVSEPMERQQTKWVVFGTTTTIIIFMVVFLALVLDPSLGLPGTLSRLVLTAVVSVAFMFVPLSIGFAILRYRLYDIDLIINRTLVYAVLTSALALVYVSSVVLLERFFRALTGQGNQLAIIISTLGSVALFNPLRRRIQDAIDRRFYRRKYDAEQVLAAFASTLRDDAYADLDRLSEALLAVVEETMQPKHVSLWRREVGLRPRERQLAEKPLQTLS